MECTLEKTKASCACTYESCIRRGKCCECVAHHNKKGEFPGCLFTKEGERSYDRSFERPVTDRKGK
jgi:hypothetical protein